MKKPPLGYMLLSLFGLSIVYAAALRKDSVTTAEVMPFAAGLVCMVVLWYWMVCNFIANRKKIAHPVFWGLFLLFANWIAAIVYFFVKYAPSESGSYFRRFREWITRNEGNRGAYAKIAAVSLIAAVVHHLFTDILYKTVSLYDFPIYRHIIGAIYFPFKASILWICRVLTIDPEHPTRNIILFARTMRFIYTYALFFVITALLLVMERRRAKRQSTL